MATSIVELYKFNITRGFLEVVAFFITDGLCPSPACARHSMKVPTLVEPIVTRTDGGSANA